MATPVGVLLFGASFVIFSAENAAVDCGTSHHSLLALREGQDKFTVGSFRCHHKRGLALSMWSRSGRRWHRHVVAALRLSSLQRLCNTTSCEACELSAAHSNGEVLPCSDGLQWQPLWTFVPCGTNRLSESQSQWSREAAVHSGLAWLQQPMRPWQI